MIRRIIILTMILSCLLSISVYAHPGKTDSKGGHHDYNNVSGLGSYHYHHGEQAHLHEYGICPYEENSQSVDNSYSSYYYSPKNVSSYSVQIADLKSDNVGTTTTKETGKIAEFWDQYKLYLIIAPCVIVLGKTLIWGCRKMREKKEKIRYCKFCGSLIDSNTKICKNCGKKFFNLKRFLSKVVVIACFVSVAGNCFLGFRCNELNKKYKDANHKYVVWKEEYEELKTDYKKYSDLLKAQIEILQDYCSVNGIKYFRGDYLDYYMESSQIEYTLPK